ncbi:MAG: ABC transporter ATP-binding protein [Bacteroidetes bacterium]|nr:ABC transporter ATP-binding protein [Bacteroidota bacterium]MBS1630566.1 ABC transporter ATP-binding protein [Bacteroidota bacterium]
MMLQAQHLHKSYGSLQVVRDVSLEVAEGEMLAIIGPSGAGKSSLLHLLGALDKPDQGQVRICDTELFSLSKRKQARFRNERLGFVFQQHHLLPEFSALENVAMPLWIAGKSRKAGLQSAEEMLERVGLSMRVQHKPSELSGGEAQRVAIARALINQPALLMADEPTGNLDTANAEAIHKLFLSLREELGQTIILITHNEALAARTDRTLVMRDGAIVEERRLAIGGKTSP